MKLRNIFFLIALLIAPITTAQRGKAQQQVNIQPDCFIAFTFTATGTIPLTTVSGNAGDNRQKGCAAWTLMYQSTGFSGVSLQFNSGASPTTTVSYGAFAGTISMGYSNPLTSTTGGSLQATNGTAVISWVQISATLTGSGTLTGVLYGFRNSSAAVNGGGSSGALPAGPTLAIESNKGGGAFDGNAANIQNFTALAVPATPVITHAGTAGMATWGYKILCGFIGGAPLALGSVPSLEGQTTTGNATLTMGNYNIITAPASVGGETSCDIYRTTTATSPTTKGLIGNVANGGNLQDTGLPAIQPFTSAPSDDYSVGAGSSNPYVNQSSGSCFGSLCLANNDPFFPFKDSATGLAVLEHSASSKFDYNAFLVDLVLDTNSAGDSAAAIDVQLGANLSQAGQYIPVFLGTFYTNGFTATGNIEAIVGTLGIDNTFTTLASSAFGSSLGISGAVTGPLAGFYQAPPQISGSVAVETIYGTWIKPSTVLIGSSLALEIAHQVEDFGPSSATNKYYEWFDSAGVYRIKEDNTFNSVGQGIPALYNPQFTKYTPGLANFERCIPGCQWESNEAWIRNEAGGTGTPRRMGLGALAGLDLSTNDVANPFTMPKTSAAAAAPGAGKVDLRVIQGTGSTCNLVMNAGTTAAEVVIVANVGGGC